MFFLFIRNYLFGSFKVQLVVTGKQVVEML